MKYKQFFCRLSTGSQKCKKNNPTSILTGAVPDDGEQAQLVLRSLKLLPWPPTLHNGVIVSHLSEAFFFFRLMLRQTLKIFPKVAEQFVMRILRLAILLLVTAGLSACGYVNGGIEEIVDNPSAAPPVTQALTNAAEIVSGSQKTVTTAGGYKISSSAGAVHDVIKSVTAGGYQVYSGVEGELLSTAQ